MTLKYLSHKRNKLTSKPPQSHFLISVSCSLQYGWDARLSPRLHVAATWTTSRKAAGYSGQYRVGKRQKSSQFVPETKVTPYIESHHCTLFLRVESRHQKPPHDFNQTNRDKTTPIPVSISSGLPHIQLGNWQRRYVSFAITPRGLGRHNTLESGSRRVTIPSYPLVNIRVRSFCHNFIYQGIRY